MNDARVTGIRPSAKEVQTAIFLNEKVRKDVKNLS